MEDVVTHLRNKNVGGGKSGDEERWWEQSRWDGFWDIYISDISISIYNLS